jgi:hypothetical protein
VRGGGRHAGGHPGRVAGDGARRRELIGLLAVGCVLLLTAAVCAGEPEGSVNYWPAYDARTDPVDGGRIQSGLGPLWMSSRSADGTVEEAGFRPFFFQRTDRTRHTREWDVLYPLMSYREDEQDWEFQLLRLLNLRGEGADPAEREERADFFPFYFSGTTAEGERYQAVFPFYGHIKDRLFQDEAEFVLFPLYARFTKADRVTTWFPWPIFGHIGGAYSGFRFFLLYGQEERPGVLERRYALWPLFLHQRAGLDTDNPVETLSILPLFVSQRSKDWERTQVLWPFFAYMEDRERRYEEWDAPWPIIKIARGEGRNITRVFPLFAVEERRLRGEYLFREITYADRFVLYPLYIRNEERYPDGRKVRDRVLFWLYSDLREEGRDGSSRRVDAWPLFRYQRDREGNEIFHTLALLEAFTPGDERVERIYSPLWSLYTYRRNSTGDAVYSFLWNLVRHEETVAGRTTVEVLGPTMTYQETAGDSRLTFLGGLFTYEADGGRRALRVGGWTVLHWDETPQIVATVEGGGGGR